MFTGLVEETGRCEWVRRNAGGARIGLHAERIDPLARVGDSVAVNGCCLTLVEREDGLLVFDLLDETLRRTNLETLEAGARVNLELPLAANGRLGGHFVQGHVDSTVAVRSVETHGADLRLDFEMPPEFAGYIAFKGSVAINGVSLTVAEVGLDTFTVWIIPHTAAITNLGALRPGDRVNLECDMLAKYVDRILQVREGSCCGGDCSCSD
jgi:riboflavin synthase